MLLLVDARESVLEREKFMCIWPFEGFRQRKNEIWSTFRKA